MKHKAHVTPGRLTVAQARIGIVIGVLFLLFGVTLAVVVAMEASTSELGLLIAQIAFFILWIAGCIAIIVFNVRILKGRHSAEQNALLDVHVEDGGTAGDFETRLRQLERLRRDGLISEAEYQDKRTQIVQERW
jgi:hypothetical protein